MKKLILFIAMCLLPTGLFSKGITNQELLKVCKDQRAGPQNFCYGFIIATTNAAEFYRNIVDVQDEYVDICFPKDVSNKEIVDIYIKWIEKNPSLRDSPAFIGVSASFSTKYSCPQKKEKTINK